MQINLKFTANSDILTTTIWHSFTLNQLAINGLI